MSKQSNIINKLKLLGYTIDKSQYNSDWAVVYRDQFGNKGFAIFENYIYVSKPIYISIVIYDNFIAAANLEHIGEYSIYNRYRNIDLVNRWSNTYYRVLNTNDGEMLILRNNRTGYIYAVGPTGMKKLIYKSKVSYHTRLEVAESDFGGILLCVSEQLCGLKGDDRIQFKETIYKIGVNLQVEQLC